MGEWQESEGRIEPSDFEEFFARSERPVRFALCARYGFEVGREATAEALAYAWENWERIKVMENPTGYVFRVGQRAGRRIAGRFDPVDFSRPGGEQHAFEPKLAPALATLSARQRTVVVLVHGLGFTHREAAGLLSLSPSSIQKHAERGLFKLRRAMGVEVES